MGENLHFKSIPSDAIVDSLNIALFWTILSNTYNILT